MIWIFNVETLNTENMFVSLIASLQDEELQKKSASLTTVMAPVFSEVGELVFSCSRGQQKWNMKSFWLWLLNLFVAEITAPRWWHDERSSGGAGEEPARGWGPLSRGHRQDDQPHPGESAEVRHTLHDDMFLMVLSGLEFRSVNAVYRPEIWVPSLWESKNICRQNKINTHDSWRYIEVLWIETIGRCKKLNIYVIHSLGNRSWACSRQSGAWTSCHIMMLCLGGY